MATDTKTNDVAAETDPLAQALSALETLAPSDSLAQDAQRQIWRRIWARDTVNNWITQVKVMPGFARKIHRGLPDDKEALQAIKLAAESISEPIMGYGIVGIVNERLERLQSSVAVAPAMASSHPYGYFPFGPSVVNYSGWVCAVARQKDPKAPLQWESDGITLRVPIKTSCQLHVWFQSTPPDDACSGDILIETGREEDFVTFGIEVDSSTLALPFGRKRLRFHRKRASDLVEFDFVSPKEEMESLVFAHVYQESSLISSLPLTVKVAR